MGHIVEELWIFSRDGIPLIEIFKNTQVDNILVGGFLSAIKTFADEVSGQNLNSLSIGKQNFHIASCLEDYVLLVCKSSSKVSQKRIKKVMDIIIKFFEDMYSKKDIEVWDGNVSYFDKLKDKLELYFEVSQI